jgi:release factor glutamine methyltransferase
MNIPSNRVPDIRKVFHKELDLQYGKDEADSIFFVLLEHFTGHGKLSLHMEEEIRVGESVINRFDEALDDLKDNKPVQYITGKANFLDFSVNVNPHVLIPRPETEELVEWITHDFEIGARFRILDIGTGSGCIAIALKRYFKNADVEAVDYDESIIKIAKENSEDNGTDIRFYNVDIMDDSVMAPQEKYNIIVSNPPYVRESEKNLMRANVIEHEPGSALFVSDEDPLIFYRKIFAAAERCLLRKGYIYLEINENMGAELEELVRSAGYADYVFRNDLNGKLRFLRVKRT